MLVNLLKCFTFEEKPKNHPRIQVSYESCSFFDASWCKKTLKKLFASKKKKDIPRISSSALQQVLSLLKLSKTVGWDWEAHFLDPLNNPSYHLLLKKQEDQSRAKLVGRESLAGPNPNPNCESAKNAVFRGGGYAVTELFPSNSLLFCVFTGSFEITRE